ncbi:hypothetical protein PMCN03_0280 [Pasteurella multocida subsp. multocida str. HB03]|nr:hypothetical protein PMCN03_0280 [Pasteurella multocida subsp. multocida str. HB03]
MAHYTVFYAKIHTKCAFFYYGFFLFSLDEKRNNKYYFLTKI